MANLQSGAQRELREIVDRIERLGEEQKALASDMKDLYTEAKGRGYDTKALRKIIALRKKSETDRNAEEAILDTYKQALGMLDGTPLGDYAERQLVAAE